MEALRGGVINTIDLEWRAGVNVVVIGRLSGVVEEGPCLTLSDHCIQSTSGGTRLTSVRSIERDISSDSQLDVGSNDLLGKRVGTVSGYETAR